MLEEEPEDTMLDEDANEDEETLLLEDTEEEEEDALLDELDEVPELHPAKIAALTIPINPMASNLFKLLFIMKFPPLLFHEIIIVYTVFILNSLTRSL